MDNPTKDLRKFGYRELDEASNLLKAYANGKYATADDEILGDGVEVWFNINSGYVFLMDEDYNVVMEDGEGRLEAHLSCSNCGSEGLRSEVEFEDDHTCSKCK